jgi:hypothetical protein
MTPDELDGIASAIAQTITAATAPLVTRIDALEQRVRELDARPSAKDGGVWQPNRAFEVGQVVSYEGSGWIVTRAHIAGATFDHAAFRLFVKRGRDGKDLR